MDPRELCKSFGIGLTGQIAMGKSTVATVLKQLGYTVIDADLLVREILTPNSPTLDTIAQTFGHDALTTDGSYNRRYMRDLVSRDKSAKKTLEEIVHPQVQSLLNEKLVGSGLLENPKVWFYEASLLIEAQRHHDLFAVWVTICPRQVQLQRLIGRSGMTEEAAKAIIATQMPLENQILHAQKIIDTNCSLENLSKIITHVTRSLAV